MNICIVYRDPSKGGTSIEEIFRGLFEILKLKTTASQYVFQAQMTLWRNVILLRKQDASLYHITGGVYFLAYFLWDRNVVLTIHDIGRYKELQGLKKVIYREILLRGPMLIAHRITAVSQYTKDDLIKVFGHHIAAKIRVIYNPVPVEFVRNRKTFNYKEPRILHVGTSKNKNLSSTIKALKNIKCNFVIIGRLSVEDIKLLEDFNIKYDNYFDLPYAGVYEQYCLSDIVVFVSGHEGFGMPVLEAQAIGRPVIASRITSIPEVGGTGVHYINDPFDAIEIASGIYKILNEETYRNELIDRGFENAKRFDAEKISLEYLTLYNEN